MSDPSPARPRGDDPARLLFLACVAIWALFPVVLLGRFAQDAVPYQAAGSLASAHPDQIYKPHAQALNDLQPRFARTSCELTPPGTDCVSENVAFVSPPPGLTFAWLVARLPRRASTFLMELIASSSLAGGMWLLWRRVAVNRRAYRAIAVSTLLLTPFALQSIAIAQTSPLMFFSACLGVEGSRNKRWLALATALLWTFTVSLKFVPLVLAAVLVWQRRWDLLALAGAALAGLVGLTALLGPLSWYRQFLDATRSIAPSTLARSENLAPAAIVHRLAGSGAPGPWGFVALGAVAAAAGWWVVRRSTPDVQWAWAWSALLLVTPLVWWHYAGLAIAALAVTAASHGRLRRRLMPFVVASAALAGILSLPQLSSHATQLPRFALLLALEAAVPVALLVDARHRPQARVSVMT